MSKSIVTVSVVNFRPAWGNKQENLERILGYLRAGARKGADVIVFPETALNGYEDTPEERMHFRDAETSDGPSVRAVEAAAKEFGVYVAFGFAHRVQDRPESIYNAGCVCGPEGLVGIYHKVHLPGKEPLWATPGDEGPLLFDTPWGEMAVAICYDVYNFPEMSRYARAAGARLLLNLTACSIQGNKPDLIRKALEYHAQINTMYIASANLAGRGKDEFFIGGSSIIGPDNNTYDHCVYYAGKGFFQENTDHPEILTETIDLSLAENNSNVHLFRRNPLTGTADWRPELYVRMYGEILMSSHWLAKNQE